MSIKSVITKIVLTVLAAAVIMLFVCTVVGLLGFICEILPTCLEVVIVAAACLALGAMIVNDLSKKDDFSSNDKIGM